LAHLDENPSSLLLPLSIFQTLSILTLSCSYGISHCTILTEGGVHRCIGLWHNVCSSLRIWVMFLHTLTSPRSTRFIVFDEEATIVAQHQVEFTQYYPHPGYNLISSVSIHALTVCCLGGMSTTRKKSSTLSEFVSPKQGRTSKKQGGRRTA